MGTILGPEGLPLEGVAIELAGAAEGKTETDATGFFGFVDLPTGAYRLRASYGRLDFRTTSGEITAGKVIVHDFRLAPVPGEDF